MKKGDVAREIYYAEGVASSLADSPKFDVTANAKMIIRTGAARLYRRGSMINIREGFLCGKMRFSWLAVSVL